MNMFAKSFFIITIAIFGTISANAQCVDSPDDKCISIRQSTVDAATKAVSELLAAREVIAAFTAERTASLAERETASRLVSRLDAVIALQDRLNLERDAITLLYKQVIQTQAELIERMSKQLNAPKSAFAKFMGALKTVATIAFGIGIGRAL